MKSISRYFRKYFTSLRSRRLNSALDKLPLQDFTLVDIGAAGDIEARWKVVERRLNYIGFEPDDRSRAALNAKKSSSKSYTIFPNALWDASGEISINLCRKPTVSSHFAPNRPFLDLFPESSRFDVQQVQTLPVTKLDDLSLPAADFMKVDIQGGELNALQGGAHTLKNAFGLELEVEFHEIYRGQPLFGVVCEFLAHQGFQFIDFLFLDRWERNASGAFGQCIFGDALFLRAPEYFQNKSNAEISKYLFICALYNRFDLITKTVAQLPSRQAEAFDEFLIALKPLRHANRRIRLINKLCSGVIRMLGGEDYRLHLMY